MQSVDDALQTILDAVLKGASSPTAAQTQFAHGLAAAQKALNGITECVASSHEVCTELTVDNPSFFLQPERESGGRRCAGEDHECDHGRRQSCCRVQVDPSLL